MRRTALLVTALLAALSALTSCSAAPTRAQFLAGFEPTREVIVRYEAIRHLPYVPRVRGHGLSAVNAAVNDITYAADTGGDRWETPAAFWTRGGDCEEYALTKGLELIAQSYHGVYLVVVHDRWRELAHAVTVVDDGGMRVLDNDRTDILPWGSVLQRYQPLYAIDLETGRVLRARNAPPIEQ